MWRNISLLIRFCPHVHRLFCSVLMTMLMVRKGSLFSIPFCLYCFSKDAQGFLLPHSVVTMGKSEESLLSGLQEIGHGAT